MKIPPRLKPWVKLLALGVGVIADGIMMFACFISQAGDDLSMVAFGTLGIMIVLLIPITYEENAKKLWLALVVLAVFFDTSYLLVSTKAKEDLSTVTTDKELTRLTEAANKASAALTTAQALYTQALANPLITKSTQADLNTQVEAARTDANAKDALRKLRFDLVESGKIQPTKITSSGIFAAIPQAVFDLRIIQLLAYALLAIVIQGMIVFSLREEAAKPGIVESFVKRKLGISEPSITEQTQTKRHWSRHDDVSRWVNATWVYARNPHRTPSGAMVKKSSFMKQVKNFDSDLYDKLLAKAISLGFIVDGICVEKDQEKVIRALT